MPHSTYLPEKMGTATVSPRGAFEAGCFEEFTVTYTAGYFGIDDSGSIKIVHRFASDMGRPQFDDPQAPNYTTVEASNGAVLQVEYDIKRNIRPWDKTLYIKVVRGYLREGDRIVVRFGDRRQGSPGIRVQTFCEHSFEFRVLVDAIATYNYVELPAQPEIAIVPGPPALWKAVLPTQRRRGESFSLKIKAEDRWGNPSDRCDQILHLRPSGPIEGLPAELRMLPGQFSAVIDGLRVADAGAREVELHDGQGALLARSNPLRIAESADLLPYWGDLHGQSEETIGTNSAREFYEFGRDRAFLDVCVHQGNDFQITTAFWEHLNELSRELSVDGEYVIFPGYEWSGNTGLGGDRNVLYMHEGRPIHRSSHALVDDLTDLDSDANSAVDLFTALRDEDCVVFAHIGGRYADIRIAHDIRLERSVEVHSAWGTFEWLIEDAFEQGYRVGIVANSDGHKGRPGASHPGATKFGSYGGLTCLLAPAFSRAAFMEALRRRHHYGTTGCRVFLDTRMHFATPADLYDDDPALGGKVVARVPEAMMGDILNYTGDTVEFEFDIHAGAPIERIDLRNGLDSLEVIRPYSEADLGSRIRVIWEGSEYRGRGRETIWDGAAQLEGNRFQRHAPINRYNIDKRFEQTAANRLEWSSLTTGGFAGFDAWLESPGAGTLRLDTALVKARIPVAEIGFEDRCFEAGGIGRRIRVYRLPAENPHRRLRLRRTLGLNTDRDNAVYIRVTLEDGHYVWSSPIYVVQ